MTLFTLSERFFARLIVTLCVLAFCAKAFGQGPTRTDVRLCSYENKTTVVRTIAKTPRFIGSCNYVRPGGRRAFILPFDRWSSKRKRVHRKFKVGSRR